MMKQLFFLLILIQLPFGIVAQQFQPNFLGNKYLTYKGISLRLKSEGILGFQHTFYGKLKYCENQYDNNVLYPDPKHDFLTIRDSLVNKVFVVENIINDVGISLSSESLTENPIFVLRDIKTDEIVYFRYDSRYEHNFPFNTSKVILSKETLCSNIEKEIDEFTGVIKLSSPITDNNRLSSMVIHKNISKNKPFYYLSVRAFGSNVVLNGRGCTVLFTDGTKWTKSVKIDVDVNSDGYVYSAFITLTPTDLLIFSNKLIKKYRLYVFDEDIKLISAEKFKLFVKCIKESK